MDSETIAVFMEKATQLHGKGLLEDAARIYNHLEREAPQYLPARYFNATIDIETGALVSARDRLRKILRSDPRSFEAIFALAFTFGELGEWQLAVDTYRRAGVVKPRSTAVGFSLAYALEVTGDLDTALQTYRSLLDIDDVRVGALLGIARIKPGDITDEEHKEMFAVAHDTDRPESVRIPLLFALGELLEKAGQFDEAFAAFLAANRMRRKQIIDNLGGPEPILIAPPHSRPRSEHPEAVARRHADIIEDRKARYTPAFVNGKSGYGREDVSPIFIVGMPRSGSTLIEQILSSHSKVQGLGEVPALWKAIVNLSAEARFTDTGQISALANEYLRLMRDYGWTGGALFVDKLLGNYLNVGAIHLMFPNARILHSVRNPVDTCLGCFRQSFKASNETTYDLKDIGEQYVRYRDMMDHWDRVLPTGRVIHVQHEELISNPTEKIKWLIEDACQLKWDENCLSFYRTKRSVRTASVVQVRQPVFRHAIDRWRKYAHHLRPLFDALGPYAPPL